MSGSTDFLSTENLLQDFQRKLFKKFLSLRERL